ncbi:stealth family protein [Streptomyces albus]|uniref:stealth family protein n=1 Tax=Streptomyces albus TaxID=1888 RepID=UPI0004CB8DB7
MKHPARSLAERLLPARVREERERQREAARAEAAERKRAERIAARRAAMLRADGEVREFTVGGAVRFGRRVRRFTAADASAHNLGLVADALAEAGVDHFLVPGRSRTRHVVGMRRSDRKVFLDAMRKLHGSRPLYVTKPSRDPQPSDTALYADGALPAALKRQSVLRFGEMLLGPRDQVLADLSHGCDVEFWDEGERLAEDSRGADRVAALRTQPPPAMLTGALVAPRGNAVSDILPADARTPAVREIAGREHPTFAGFLQPRVETVGFPLDIVYTWVDGADPELSAKRAAYRDGGAGGDGGGEAVGAGGKEPPRIHARETGASRYTSRDELKYSLRSLEMYAPFVRSVYIVTDGQVPSWLNTAAPGIRVVDHKEIFTDPTGLPVFNSHAIGTQLHHIPGLSDRYLYFNDDVFLGRPVGPEAFFHGNGMAKLPFSPAQLGLGAPHPDEPAPNSAGKNVRRLMLEAHGRFTVNKFMHTPHPQIRAVMEEIEERFAEDVERTSRSRFRSVTDIAMGASLHHHHAYLTGRAVPGSYKLRYVDVARPDAEERLAELLSTRCFDFFCLNDVDTPAGEQERIAARLHAFLEEYFPFPSRFER